MKLTQYCTRCGHRLELDFGRRWRKGQCPACKLKFKFREEKDGALTYDYKADDMAELYIGNDRLIDLAKKTEVRPNGAI